MGKPSLHWKLVDIETGIIKFNPVIIQCHVRYRHGIYAIRRKHL